MKAKPVDSMWTDEQWDAITTRDSNVLVSAGAGSGKTAVLSERVLELVREGVDVTDLIVLTFTNAAAAEMKERIRKKLLKDGMSNPLVLESANKIDRSFISTFDSYCLYLVKKYNYILNVSQQISIIDNITANREKYNLMKALLENHVTNQNKDVIDFITTYSATSIDEIISILLSWYNSSIQNMNDFELQSSHEIFAIYEQFVLEQHNRIKYLIEEISKYAADTNLPEKIEERTSILLASNSYSEIHQSIELIFESRFWQVPRKEFPDKDHVKALNDELKDQLKKLRVYASKSQTVQISLLENNSSYKQLINQLLEQFKTKFDQYKVENGLFEFIDINLLAIKLLRENDDIRNGLKQSVYEIMIDEYQDTNDIQEQFVSLIANNNVYMVGDIKQSIYGFRNANPKLFATKFNQYKNGQGGKLITLTNNFRSRSSVLDQVNDFFSLTMSDEYGGIEYDHNQKMNYGNRSYDKLADTNTNEIITYNSDEIEIDKSDYEIVQIFKDIRNKLDQNYQVVEGSDVRPVTLSDFAIICATREKFERIAKIGEYFNISVNADIQEQFSSSSEIAVIQSAFNIVNVVKNNSDDDQKIIFSIIQLARSYLFDYSDDQIDQAIQAVNRVSADKVSAKLYVLTTGPLQQLGELLTNLTANIDLKSNQYILEQIIAELNIVNKLYRLSNPLIRQMRIAKLVELIADYDGRNYSLAVVCDILNEIEKNDDLDIDFNTKSELETESVTVITIHKSKGLEYNICYFPFLFKKFNAMDLNNKIAYNNYFQFIFPSKMDNGNLTATIEKSIYNNQGKIDLISEKIRLLYVAITRAKDKNILIVDTKQIEAEKIKPIHFANSTNDLLFAGWDSLKKYIVDSYKLNQDEIDTCKYNRFVTKATEDKKAPKLAVYNQLEVNAPSFEKRKASMSITELITSKVASNIELGNQVHEQLEFINLFEIDKLISDTQGELKVALTSIKNSNLLKGMINYYPEFQFKIIEEGELNGIIDLLVETEDKFVIVDYKLNNVDKAEYQTQVMTYVNYIQSISNKKVEGYLLSLMSGSVKKVY